MELFFTKMRMRDGNVLWLRTELEGLNSSLNKNFKNRTEGDDRSSTQNETEWNGAEQERNDKKRNESGTDSAEGPRSRTPNCQHHHQWAQSLYLSN